jgi:dihydroneopterin aldolase
MDQVIINDLKVRAVIGINEEERSHLWKLIINLVIFTDFSQSAKSDDIQDCINYATVAEKVKAFVERTTRHTVEALAEDIARLCLGMQGVDRVKVRVEKPGVVQSTNLVGVEIDRFADKFPKTLQVGSSREDIGHGNLDSPQPWKIRQAVEADIPALVDLRARMFESMGYTGQAELELQRKDSYTYMNKNLPGGEFSAWVGDVNGQVVASAALVIHAVPPTIQNRSGLQGYIMSVFTLPEWRRKGIARAIMLTIKNYLLFQGITSAALRTTEQGFPLYRSLGFSPDDKMMVADL